MYGIGGTNKMNFNEKNDYYKKQKEYIEKEIILINIHRINKKIIDLDRYF